MQELTELNVPLEFEKTLASNVNLTAYLFNRAGQLLQQAPVNNGQASFTGLKNTTTNDLRVLVAPDISDQKISVRSIKDLDRFKPYEPVLRFDDKGKLTLLPIPARLIDIWQIRLCRVIGKVKKDFTIDGRPVEKPLCKARVHICEIDKIWFWIDRIPDWVLLRIPDLILKPIPKIPIPTPDPGPLFQNVFTRRVANPLIAISAQNNNLNIGNVTLLQQRLPVVEPKIKDALQSNNVLTIKNTLTANLEIFHPYFCFYPWIWPWLYRCDELKTVYTDDNGRFDTPIVYWATGDKPDIYIWVEYLINGVWTTVYRPPIPCNTFWDYACGTEILVNVTDSRVRAGCNETIAGEQVWVRGVGGVSVRNIKQNDTDLSPLQGVPFHRIGLNKQPLYQLSISDNISPFATGLDFIIKFGSSFPNSNAKYFRWKSIKLANGDLSPFGGATTHFLSDTVRKYYYVEYIDGMGNAQTTTKAHTLGPVEGTAGLYLIPPASPFNFLGETNASATWQHADTTTANFDSNGLDGDGLYEFTLELFDQSGNKVFHDPTLYKVPTVSDSGTSENATPEFLSFDAAHGTWDFKFLIRIDNTATVADIHDAEVLLGGGASNKSGPCGFIKYTNPALQQVQLSFKAFHPNNFATFSFSVVKGNGTESCPGSTSGFVISNTPGYARVGDGEYSSSPDFTPAAMLGSCAASGKAAYAETLGVYGLHNNGYNRVTLFDSGETNAFALEP